MSLRASRIALKSGWLPLLDELLVLEALISLLLSTLICPVTLVFSRPVSLAVFADCRMERPIVAAAAMIATMMAMSMLRPLLRITLFQAFLNTNIAILNRLCEVDGSTCLRYIAP